MSWPARSGRTRWPSASACSPSTRGTGRYWSSPPPRPAGGSPLPEGSGRGIAVHESFNTCVAQVAEVSIRDQQIRADRAVIAVDCGPVVNPDPIAAQMEGGMYFGLGAALKSAITLEHGGVVEFSFHEYRVLCMREMPRVQVPILPSAAPPTGVGERATPVIAPAVANALFAATGQRLRSLPLPLDA